jgi:Fic family protein
MRNSNLHTAYIWQRPEWHRFKWDAEALLLPLAQLSQLHGQLTGQMSMLGASEKNEANLYALANELIHSSNIEGVTLNADSVRSSLARRLGMDPDGLPTEDHYVEGLVDVMLDAVNHCCQPLSEERLRGWHCALFPTGHSGMHRITVGGWRQGDAAMQVVSGAMGHERVHFEAPPSSAVSQEMQAFITWCNHCTLSPFVKAAIAHLWFVTIHPFDDGNGRISRTIADMYLAEMDGANPRYYSMSAEINRHKKAYYEILERTQKGDLDITPWIQWFLECLKRAILRSLETLKATLRKAAFWDHIRPVPLNERQHKIINQLWDGFEGKLTTSKWAKICHCSQDTALRDIRDLMGKGILCDSGENGRNKNYVLTVNIEGGA